MKRPLILSLAIAFAFHGSAALALGLGPVHVKSRLNQPLDAEISIVQGSVDEAAGLIVQLASGEDFDRVGLDRSRISVPLEFTLARNSRGEPVIRVTSKEAIREPFLDFLVEANWPKGRLLREYTVLLDPPVTAPVRAQAPVVASQPAAPATTTTRPLTPRPAPHAAPATKPAAPVAKAPREVARPASPAPAAAPRAVATGEYGPVAAGETLWEIARAERDDGAVNINRMMLAILRENPQAFADGNINALKRGAILRMPDAETLAAVGSAKDAANEVARQTQAWRNARGGEPTRVASVAPASSRSAPAPEQASRPAGSRKDTERLTLVPPRAGKDSLAANGTPAAGAGNAEGEVRAELARVRESLSSREQESSELKSRVAELEEINAKSSRLLGLKDSEIADLQRRLAELSKQNTAVPAAAPATVVVPPPAESPAPTGDEDATPATVPGTAGDATAPAPDASSATPTPATGDIWGNPDAAVAASGDQPGAPDAGATSAAGTEPAEFADSAEAREAAPASTPASSGVDAEASSPATTEPPVAPAAGLSRTPPVPAAPWYTRSWVRIAALLGAVLLVLFGLLGLRGRTPAVATPRSSIAGAFGDHPPVVRSPTPPLEDPASTEEEILRQQLAEHPEDIGLHLELLSLYYADNDVAAFEVAAQEMATHVGESDQLEWQQVRAMGAELAPHNPLFMEGDAGQDEGVDGADFDDLDIGGEPAGDTIDGHASADERDDRTVLNPQWDTAPIHDEQATREFQRFVPDSSADRTAPDEDFLFEVPAPESPIDVPEVGAPEISSSAASFEFGDTGDGIDYTPPSGGAALEPDSESADFPASEDAIGTKLDLARAYLDMGDPDGARAMLEEVLGEGNPDQQDEARRLIAEIR
jgi:pilus assembly protein FimV